MAYQRFQLKSHVRCELFPFTQVGLNDTDHHSTLSYCLPLPTLKETPEYPVAEYHFVGTRMHLNKDGHILS